MNRISAIKCYGFDDKPRSQLHLLLWESIMYYAYLLTIPPRPRNHDKVV